MSRQGDIISTVFYRLSKENWDTEKAVDFAFEVLCDAGQIDSDENGDILPEDKNWLSKLYDEKYKF